MTPLDFVADDLGGGACIQLFDAHGQLLHQTGDAQPEDPAGLRRRAARVRLVDWTGCVLVDLPVSKPKLNSRNDMDQSQLQQDFADRLGGTLENARQLLPAEQVFEASIGAAVGFALLHAEGPAIAETLRRLAAELQSHRPRGSAEH